MTQACAFSAADIAAIVAVRQVQISGTKRAAIPSNRIGSIMSLSQVATAPASGPESENRVLNPFLGRAT